MHPDHGGHMSERCKKEKKGDNDTVRRCWSSFWGVLMTLFFTIRMSNCRSSQK
jgi:hypothetical protein